MLSKGMGVNQYLPDVDVFTGLGVTHDKFDAGRWCDWASVLRLSVGLSSTLHRNDSRTTNLISKSTHSSTYWLLNNLKTEFVICQYERSSMIERSLPVDSVVILAAYATRLIRGLRNCWK